MREASSDQEQTTSAMTSMTSQYCPRHHHHTQQQQQAPQQQQQQQRQTPSPNKRHRLTPRPHNIQRPCLDFEKMQQVIKISSITRNLLVRDIAMQIGRNYKEMG